MDQKNSKELLKKFVYSKSQYFDLPDGGEAKAKFLSVEEVSNKFDGGETMLIRYHLEIGGKELLWDRGSRSLAQQMSDVAPGSLIFIKRTGKGNQTKYEIRKAE